MGKTDKFGCGMKSELLKERKEEQEKVKRELEDNRLREAEELKKSGKNAAKNVLFASY